MLDKLKDLDLRYEDLESQLGDPRVYGDAEKLRQVNRELKELLDEGILTQDEFDAQKKAILEKRS